MPQPRVRLQGLESNPVLMQSEEHLVLECADPSTLAIGDAVLGVPRHVCPTVSMHNQAIPFRAGKAGKPWKIAARGRQYEP
jgi:D-serine deaminase-like pyridoxal phosphate-dependent protein